MWWNSKLLYNLKTQTKSRALRHTSPLSPTCHSFLQAQVFKSPLGATLKRESLLKEQYVSLKAGRRGEMVVASSCWNAQKHKMARGVVDVYIHAYICYPSRSSLPVSSQPIPHLKAPSFQGYHPDSLFLWINVHHSTASFANALSASNTILKLWISRYAINSNTCM